jgi:hypothetical protein
MAALSFSCATASTTECFDIAGEGANITHIFVDSGCAASEYAITADGEPVTELYTDGGPCKSIPRDVWFPLEGNQDTALVCVSILEDCPEGIQVYAKAKSKCIAGTQP